MNQKTKNLALVGAAVAVVGFVAVNTLIAPPAAPPAVAGDGGAGTVASKLPAAGSPGGATPADVFAGSSASTAKTAAASPGPAGVQRPGTPATALGTEPLPGSDRRSYAVGQNELAGLPPDAAPGTPLELWVTWEPPLSRGPRLQRLIGDVVLERTIPGPVPEAPVTVLLSVPTNRIGDLIYADGYGRLSAVLPG